MIRPKVGFIVYGVHKDGIKDPLGIPFINDCIVNESIAVLKKQGLELVEYNEVIASKADSRNAFIIMKNDDAIDCVILFSGT
jgi:hypothetical protein